jgi:hypothetical protein
LTPLRPTKTLLRQFGILMKSDKFIQVREVLKQTSQHNINERFEFSKIWLGFHFMPDFLKNRDWVENITGRG